MIDEDTIQIFEQYDWPGNIRELRNLIERIVVVCEDSVVRKVHLKDSIKNMEYNTKKQNDIISMDISNRLNEYMKNIILEALNKANGNRTLASKILKISRKTLYNRMKELGIKHAFTTES
jgi:transcriptional regulator with PAS, ATPase and Fis domain